jgi:hypothetical protein
MVAMATRAGNLPSLNQRALAARNSRSPLSTGLINETEQGYLIGPLFLLPKKWTNKLSPTKN